MPPFLPRKRLRSPSPSEASTSVAPTAKSQTTPASRRPSLFDSLDAGTRPSRSQDNGKALLAKFAAASDDESSLSSLSSADEEFEDVPAAKRPKLQHQVNSEEDDDEDIEFEDVETGASAVRSAAPMPSGDLELILNKDTRISLIRLPGTKKGPSKVERGIRVATHQIHVMMLMWHNAVRNAWLCDKELQSILVDHLGPGVKKEVERWRAKSGVAAHRAEESVTPKKGRSRGRKTSKGQDQDIRNQRDWGKPAEGQAHGQVDMSHGDPLFKLLSVLKSFWRQRFRITAPGLRKVGYMSLQRLDEEVKSFSKSSSDLDRHGECIKDLEQFKDCARKLEGSRDVGAQMFTALLRGLGLEARLVASLQPVGFGWNKNEDAVERKEKKPAIVSLEISSSEGETSEEEDVEVRTVSKSKSKVKFTGERKEAAVESSRRISRGNVESSPIVLSDSEMDAQMNETEGDSVVDITMAKPRRLPSKPYDRDLSYPHYWTEVLSPVRNVYTPVDAVVLDIIATNSEMFAKFESRGQKSEKAKQVTAYIIGHSSDGTAKDVTVRYLKNHTLPGRTKGVRIPVEKMPVHNAKGKLKYYEHYDWFKTVMSGYVRWTKKCPRDEIDEHEDATDLKVVQPQKKEVKEGEETLQYFKSSLEFILERHLKREEALKPNAKHVKMFSVKTKGETAEEKVFLRKDVVHCKSMETWHKEGREPRSGEISLKRVPFRAATTNRKRELAEAEHASGEKMLQGLYSKDQTEWIVPPPIADGVIPKNAFGNMDLYVPSMCPAGAVHLPYRGLVKICKKLGIDYAEAVTGFEFGARMAIPIITGVVVAEENEDTVMEQWEKDEEERVRKEDEKRKKKALGAWRSWLMKLRVMKRFQEEYGEEPELDVLEDREHLEDAEVIQQASKMRLNDEDMAGGFLPEGHDEELHEHHSSTFFPVANDDEDQLGGGGFVLEDFDEDTSPKASIGQAYATPQSLESSHTPKASKSDMDLEGAFTPPPKKRGRPASSNAATTTKTQKAKTTRPTQRRSRNTPLSRHKGQTELSEQGDEEEQSLELSDVHSDKSLSEAEVVKTAKTRKTTSSEKMHVEATRKTPKRSAKAMKEGGTRSKYFEPSENDED